MRTSLYLALLLLASAADALSLVSRSGLMRAPSALTASGGRSGPLVMAVNDAEVIRLQLLANAKSALRKNTIEVLLSHKGVSQIATLVPGMTTDTLVDRAVELHGLQGQKPTLIAKGTRLRPGMDISESPITGTSAGSSEAGERVLVLL